MVLPQWSGVKKRFDEEETQKLCGKEKVLGAMVSKDDDAESSEPWKDA